MMAKTHICENYDYDYNNGDSWRTCQDCGKQQHFNFRNGRWEE